MIFTNTSFAEDLAKAASENVSLQPAKIKHIHPKVGNFEH